MKVNIVALGFLAASAVAVPLSSNNVDEPAKPTEIQTKEKKTLPTADGLPDVPEACVMPSGCVHGKTSLPPPTVPTVTKSPPHKTKSPPHKTKSPPHKTKAPHHKTKAPHHWASSPPHPTKTPVSSHTLW